MESGQNFAHATTAGLSCRVQKCDPHLMIKIELGQKVNKISNKKILCEMGPSVQGPFY